MNSTLLTVMFHSLAGRLLDDLSDKGPSVFGADICLIFVKMYSMILTDTRSFCTILVPE